MLHPASEVFWYAFLLEKHDPDRNSGYYQEDQSDQSETYAQAPGAYRIDPVILRIFGIDKKFADLIELGIAPVAVDILVNDIFAATVNKAVDRAFLAWAAVSGL